MDHSGSRAGLPFFVMVFDDGLGRQGALQLVNIDGRAHSSFGPRRVEGIPDRSSLSVSIKLRPGPAPRGG